VCNRVANDDALSWHAACLDIANVYHKFNTRDYLEGTFSVPPISHTAYNTFRRDLNPQTSLGMALSKT
jgi:hypothetical protein